MLRWMMPLVLLLAVLTGNLSVAHDTAAVSGPMTLTAHDLLRYLHIVLLVFWLGPDVAITIAGSYATNSQLNAAQRAGAARMAEYYAIMPQVCMSLMLTVGGLLSEYVGLEHPWWQMAGIILLGPVWLTLTLLACFGWGGAGAVSARLEHALRIALIVGIPVSVTYSIVTGRMAEAPYVGGKLILFALLLLLGLFIRRAYEPFRDGVKKLARDGASPELDQRIAASFSKGRRLVYVSWALLLLAALAGVVKPGAAEAEPAAAALTSPAIASSL